VNDDEDHIIAGLAFIKHRKNAIEYAVRAETRVRDR